MGRRILYFVASSLDGFLARPDGRIDWLFTDQDYGYTEFLGGIDTVVMGRKTYELCLTFGEYPYKTKKNYVFSRTQAHFEHATAVQTPLAEFAAALRREPGSDIWLVGGGELAGDFFQAGLVDELQIFVHPRLIGSGLPVVAGLGRDVILKLEETHPFPTGLVKLRYSVAS